MSCPRESEIDRLVGGSLEPAEAAALESHVTGCPACAAERDRARREAETYRRRLAPLRISGGLKEEIMASLPDTIPTASATPRVGVARWAVAATILVAALIAVMVTPGRSPSLPATPSPASSPSQDGPGFPVTKAMITRRDGLGKAAGPTQHLLPEEIPYTLELLRVAGFWSELKVLKTEDSFRNGDDVFDVELAAGSGPESKSLGVELWRWPSERDTVGQLFNRDGCLLGHPSKETFNRLWSIFERAMNPLQVYVDGEVGPEGNLPGSLLLAYRGGRGPWGRFDPRLHASIRRKQERDYLGKEFSLGREASLGATLLSQKAPATDSPFAIRVPLQDLALEERAAEYTFSMDWGKNSSPTAVLFWKDAPRLFAFEEGLKAARHRDQPFFCYVHKIGWIGEEKALSALEQAVDSFGRVAGDYIAVLGHLNVEVEQKWADLYELKKVDGGIVMLDPWNAGLSQVLARDDAATLEALRKAAVEGMKAWEPRAACRKAAIITFVAVQNRDLERFKVSTRAIFREPGPDGKSAIDSIYELLIADEVFKAHFAILERKHGYVWVENAWPADAETSLKFKAKDPELSELWSVEVPVWEEPGDGVQPTLKMMYLVGRFGKAWRVVF